MTGTTTLFLILWGAVTLFPVGALSQGIPDGPYFGQKPPGLTPEVFAPGVISLDDRFEYTLVFSPDMDECIFGLTNQTWNYFTFLYTRMEKDGSWSDPVRAPFQGDGDGLLPAFTQDGGEVFFVSSRPNYPPTNVWRSVRNGEQWSGPVALPPPVNSGTNEYGTSLTANGTLYFTSDRNGGYGSQDIYRAVKVGGQYTSVENLGPMINSPYTDASPYVSPDERYLIFESDRPGGHGQPDLYISFRVDGAWTEARNLGPGINTDKIDDVPFVSPDGNYLFFNRRESWVTSVPTDIYWVDIRAIFPEKVVVSGPGPGYGNPALIRVFGAHQDAPWFVEFSAFGAPHYGANIDTFETDGSPPVEILSGAGPGALFGPHVRGFSLYGIPLPGLSFLAYGTNHFGVNVASGDLDGQGFDEIVTGAGPGPIFGPHVRGWTYNGSTVAPLVGVSFFAYGTHRWGVNVAAGDIDGDGYDEIVTGAGPGPGFGPHVRGWNVDGGAAAAISEVSFFAYGTPGFGVVTACGDLDGDGVDEILTAPGPSPSFGPHIRGWNFDGGSVSALAGCSFFAWPPSMHAFGAEVNAADLDDDGRAELIVGHGPDPAAGTGVKVFQYNGVQVTELFGLEAYPQSWTHGTTVAGG